MTKDIVGIAMILIGIAVGFYVSVVLCLVGGIWDLIHFAQSSYTSYPLLVWGIVKLFCMTLAGTVSSYLLIVPGVVLLKSAK